MLSNASLYNEIEEKIEQRQILSPEDIVFLYDTADINWLGGLAGKMADNVSSNYVSFVSNLILNYTNICNVRCKFCAFYRTGPEGDAYTFTEDRVIEEIAKYYAPYRIAIWPISTPFVSQDVCITGSWELKTTLAIAMFLITSRPPVLSVTTPSFSS